MGKPQFDNNNFDIIKPQYERRWILRAGMAALFSGAAVSVAGSIDMQDRKLSGPAQSMFRYLSERHPHIDEAILRDVSEVFADDERVLHVIEASVSSVLSYKLMASDYFRKSLDEGEPQFAAVGVCVSGILFHQQGYGLDDDVFSWEEIYKSTEVLGYLVDEHSMSYSNADLLSGNVAAYVYNDLLPKNAHWIVPSITATIVAKIREDNIEARRLQNYKDELGHAPGPWDM